MGEERKKPFDVRICGVLILSYLAVNLKI